MTTTAPSSTGDAVGDPELRPHFDAMPAIVGDRHSFPSHAELARTLVGSGALSAVATITETGHPYTSIVPISTIDHGAPVVCISQLAEHTINLRRDPRASVLVHSDVDELHDPLALPRVTLVGSFMPFEPADETIDAHLAIHPHSALYARFPDFEWWRFELLHARFVGGFGVMGWVSAAEYAGAASDPVIPHSAPMIAHLNDDHADACVEIARTLAGVDDAVSALVTGLDRYGMTMEVRDHPLDAATDAASDPETEHDSDSSSESGADRRVEPMTTALAIARVAFEQPLASSQEVRGATIELAERAHRHTGAPDRPSGRPSDHRPEQPSGRTPGETSGHTSGRTPGHPPDAASEQRTEGTRT